MSLEPPVEAVYSSPYYRCLQTINPFVELQQGRLANTYQGPEPAKPLDTTAATIRPEYGLCEWFGSAPFDHPTPAPPEMLKTMFPAYDDNYRSARSPSRRGETLAQLYERVAAAAQAIVDHCDAEDRRAVILCTHAAVVIALGRVLTGDIPDDVEREDFRAFTCGLTTYRRAAVPSTKSKAPCKWPAAFLGALYRGADQQQQQAT